jgi:hypothetical protein
MECADDGLGNALETLLGTLGSEKRRQPVMECPRIRQIARPDGMREPAREIDCTAERIDHVMLIRYPDKREKWVICAPNKLRERRDDRACDDQSTF